MANFLQSGDNYKVRIPGWHDIDKITHYVIEIDVGGVSWSVSKRYSEFSTLHIALVADHGLQIDILPPKKLIGNRCEDFIESRRRGLEAYLSTVVQFLQKTMPKKLAVFLKFHQFDVTFIAKNLAINFYQCGETILSKLRHHTLTSLELFAINERLKQPCSNFDLLDQREDFSHVLDFCYQLKELVVNGSNDPIEGSNIIPNNLALNFSVFKSLEVLSLNNVNYASIVDVGSLRQTLQRLTLRGGRLSRLENVLLCDQLHKNDLGQHNEWQITEICIIDNKIDLIDESTCLLPNLKSMQLDNNQITNICNLGSLENLVHLSLAHNLLRELTFPGIWKLVRLDLSENCISHLKPFGQLTCLETLNLQINKIVEVNEVSYISSLPYLENLILTGNPVSQVVDYRIKVLEHFGSRAYRICLDNESADQTELDKVAIMVALHHQRRSGGSNT